MNGFIPPGMTKTSNYHQNSSFSSAHTENSLSACYRSLSPTPLYQSATHKRYIKKEALMSLTAANLPRVPSLHPHLHKPAKYNKKLTKNHDFRLAESKSQKSHKIPKLPHKIRTPLTSPLTSTLTSPVNSPLTSPVHSPSFGHNSPNFGHSTPNFGQKTFNLSSRENRQNNYQNNFKNNHKNNHQNNHQNNYKTITKINSCLLP